MCWKGRNPAIQLGRDEPLRSIEAFSTACPLGYRPSQIDVSTAVWRAEHELSDAHFLRVTSRDFLDPSADKAEIQAATPVWETNGTFIGRNSA